MQVDICYNGELALAVKYSALHPRYAIVQGNIGLITAPFITLCHLLLWSSLEGIFSPLVTHLSSYIYSYFAFISTMYATTFCYDVVGITPLRLATITETSSNYKNGSTPF